MWKGIVLATALAVLAGVGGVAQAAATKEIPKQQSNEAKKIEGLPIYSSDGKEVGRVASVDVGANGSIKSVRAEIEGFLGLGTGMVTILSDQFKHEGDRLVLSQTADAVRGMPGAAHQSFDGAGSGSPPPGAP
jgi:sporulation protein YlmC with PRC-barrel domain